MKMKSNGRKQRKWMYSIASIVEAKLQTCSTSTNKYRLAGLVSLPNRKKLQTYLDGNARYRQGAAPHDSHYAKQSPKDVVALLRPALGRLRGGGLGSELVSNERSGVTWFVADFVAIVLAINTNNFFLDGIDGQPPLAIAIAIAIANPQREGRPEKAGQARRVSLPGCCPTGAEARQEAAECVRGVFGL